MLQATEKINYPMLWKRVEREHPEIAGKILASHIRTIPFDSKLENIPKYSATFSVHQTIGSVDSKRKLIACLLHIYSPDTLKQPGKFQTFKRGLCTATANTLQLGKPYTSELIQEAIAHYRCYDDFRQSVDILTSKIKGGV